jgi:hypothetical protein
MAATMACSVGLLIGAIGIPAVAIAAGTDPTPLRVAVQNLDEDAAAALTDAEAEATAIFRSAGVALDWKPAGEGLLTIVILPERMAARMTSQTEDLGLTPALANGERSRRAYIFSSRVRVTANTLRLNAAKLLGCAMAHELGHMLLPIHSHTPLGVMRGHWDAKHLSLDGLNDLRFMPNQEAEIRREVERLQSTPTAPRV